jgi:hypothetical protein
LLGLLGALVAAGVVAVLIVVLTGGDGNGSSADPEQAGTTVEQMLAALRAHDPESACAFFSPEGEQRFLEGQGSSYAPAGSCEGQMRQLIFTTYPYDVSDPAVSPDGQQVAFDVFNTNQLSHNLFVLEPDAGGWSVVLIGAQATRLTQEGLDEVRNGGITDFERYVP